MRALLIILLLALLIGSAAVYAVNLDPGYVLLAWGNTTVEMTAWVFAISLLLALSMIALFYWLLTRGLKLRYRVSLWRLLGKDNSIHSITAKGLAAYEEGHWARARKMLSKVGDKSDNALVFYLMCARASHALGDSAQISEFLRKATQNAPNASVAISLTQAQMQLKDGSLEACLATLIRAQTVDEAHPAVLTMLVEVYEGLKDWQSLSDLLPRLKNDQLLSLDEYQRVERTCYESLLNSVDGDAKALQSRWKKLPATPKKDVQLVGTYVDCLVRLSLHDEAERVLRSALDVMLEAPLLARYGKIVSSDLKQQLLFTQSLLKREKASAALLFCCARLALASGLMGQAEAYFTQAYKLGSTRLLCAEIAHFYMSKGDAATAKQYLNECIDAFA